MLPVLDPQEALSVHYQDYLDALRASDFTGDIETAYSSRFAMATDNSIYQKLPQAVVYPKSVNDLSIIGRVANDFPEVVFSARGGGTGTNGQSLTSGIIVETARYMNQILEINAEERWVRVQSGVVKDALNDALRPFGFFFAPDLSTSNRATIGGMINTDASGQGSLVYGKTSDHILGLTSVLVNGDVLHTKPTSIDDCLAHAQSSYAQISEQIQTSCVAKRDQILAKFPRLNRFLTGYDLEHAYIPEQQQFDISRLIAGSEGSLAFVAEAKLNITPIAKHKALVNIKYNSFESALRHAPKMVEAEATSVETVDSKVLNLAKADIIWHSVSDLIQDVPNSELLGLNMVEYNSEDETEITTKITALEARLQAEIESGETGVIGFQVTYDVADIQKIYAMRKKAVGLLGKTDGAKKPIAFAEDTAVPPENLADFIIEFRDLLDSHKLDYGMFGHVDAGVLHVRPALDMNDPQQEVLLKQISDQVVALVAKYGGLMWGEHGKGYRSEYAPEFFGEELYTELRKIKAVFDPLNKMNPGKICTPYKSDAELVKVSDTKRGAFDRTIPVVLKEEYEPAMSCNGNGLCFNYDTTSPMCPSFKITAERRHSPKGRAGMIREWLRLLEKQGVDTNSLDATQGTTSWLSRLINTNSAQSKGDFSHEVMQVMDECLACKSCSSQCPVGVDVPDFRAKFIALYYQRYSRPVKDYLVANIERMAPWLAKIAPLHNAVMRSRLVQWALRESVGYVDAPLLSTPTLKKRVSTKFDMSALQQLSHVQKAQTVLIVQDPFTSFYDAQVVEDFVLLAQKLGFNPVLLPFNPNGKPQHVKGFLAEFATTAKSTAAFLNDIASLNIPMVGVDASLLLVYRDEYTKTLGAKRGEFSVLAVHEWLVQHAASAIVKNQAQSEHELALFTHCTEKTALPTSEKQWQKIFADAGLELGIVSVGCCGMAGTYGHEVVHLHNSKGIYDLSWRDAIARFAPEQRAVTGYSCRSQVARYSDGKPRHPLQILLNSLLE
ncbi:MAG: FAD-binding protein [Alteromonadaceae bacterium]|nr:FAD-binding protein [Alteromonadaceae bacterium]